MKRLKLIIDILFGKDIVVYNTWTKEILLIIGSDIDILKNRYDYKLISPYEEYIEEKDVGVYLVQKER